MSAFSIQLGQRMRARRAELGITQEQVALACCITKSTVSRYEKGSIEHPHRPTVEAIAKILRVQPAWLLGQSEQREAAPDTVSQDVRQIMSQAKAQLLRQEGLMFDGVPVSAQALQSILDAMDIGLTMAAQRQKKQK